MDEQDRGDLATGSPPTSFVPSGQFAWLFNFIAGHPWLILTVFFGVVAASAFSLRNLQFHSSSETYANSNDPSLIAFREHQELFAADDPIIVASMGEGTVFEAGRLQRLEKLHRALAELPGVAETYSLIDCGNAESVDGAIEVGRLMEDLPTTDAEVVALQNAVRRNEAIRNSLLSPDEQTAIIIVVPETTTGDPLARPAELALSIDRLRESHNDQEHIAVAGHPYSASIVGLTSRHDVFFFAPFTTLILFLLLAFMYRSLWAAVIPLTTSGAVSAIVIGLQVGGGNKLSEMDAMLPTLFTAIGVAYSMHLLDRFASGLGSASSRTKASIEKVALPLVVSGITTAAGFSALATSSVEGTRSFGLLGAIGIVLTTLAVLLVVPALLVVVGPNLRARTGNSSLASRFLSGLRSTAINRPLAITLLFAVLSTVATAGILRISVDNSPVGWLPSSHPARADIEALGRAGVGTTLVYVTLDSGEKNGAIAPDFLTRARALSDSLNDDPSVSSVVSLEPMLRHIHQIATNDPEADLPSNASLLAQYMLLYESSESASQVDDFVDFDRRRLSVVLRTHAQRSSEWWPLKKKIRAALGQHFRESASSIAGPFPMMFESGDDIAPEQVRSLAIALLIIVATLILVLRSFRWGLLAIPSNVIPILALFGIMGWANVDLDIISAIIACTTLGIVVDDTVHFIVVYRESFDVSRSVEFATDEAFRIAGRPIVFTTVAIVSSFLVFLSSDFASIVQVGYLATSGIVVALFTDLLLLPILLRWFSPRTKHPASETAT